MSRVRDQLSGPGNAEPGDVQDHVEVVQIVGVLKKMILHERRRRRSTTSMWWAAWACETFISWLITSMRSFEGRD